MTFLEFNTNLTPDQVTDWWNNIAPRKAPEKDENKNWKYWLSKNGKKLPFKFAIRNLADYSEQKLDSFISNDTTRNQFCEKFDFEIEEDLVFDNTENQKFVDVYSTRIKSSEKFQQFLNYVSDVVEKVKITPYHIRMAINPSHEFLVIVSMRNILSYSEKNGKSIVGFIIGQQEFDTIKDRVKVYNAYEFKGGDAKVFLEIEIDGWNTIPQDLFTANFNEIKNYYEKEKTSKLIRWNSDAKTSNSVLKYLAFKRIPVETFLAENESKLKSISGTIDIGSHKIYKASMGSFSKPQYDHYLLENKLLVHEKTRSSGTTKIQPGEFFEKELEMGSYIYLCHGSKQITIIARITSEARRSFENKDGWWLERSYEVVAESITHEPYIGPIKLWAPNGNSTFVEINKTELKKANELIFEPFFEKKIISNSEAGYFWQDIEVYFPKRNLENHSYWQVDFRKKLRIPEDTKEVFVKYKNQDYENVNLVKGGELNFGKKRNREFLNQNAELQDGDLIILRIGYRVDNGNVRQHIFDLYFKYLIENESRSKQSANFNSQNAQKLIPPKWTSEYGSDFSEVSLTKENLDRIKIIANSNFNNEFDGKTLFINFINHLLKTTRPMSSLNQILYGPPGTGKTYNSVNLAISIINPEFDLSQNRKLVKAEYDRLCKLEQIVFTTFHQSMSYEDFIEGIKPLKPLATDNFVKYEVQPGIFKVISEKAKSNYENAKSENKNKLQFEEAFEQLKEEWEENPEMKFALKTKGYDFTIIGFTNSSIQFKKASGGTGHTLSINTLREQYYGKEYNFKQGVGIYYPPILQKIQTYQVDAKSEVSLLPYVIIIDEINRGNVSQIFGELITLIEDDKRLGKDEELSVELTYSKDKFSVPQNLYIIGTMNTADRSVEAIDTALRRRFSFTEMLPDSTKIKQEGFNNGIVTISNSKDSIDLKNLLDVINERIEVLVDRDHTIGHSFFMNVKDLDGLRNVFQNKIIPLLQEYFYGDYRKMEMVIGPEFFIKQEMKKVTFATKSEDFDTERAVYKLKKIDSVDFDITKALDRLMNISKAISESQIEQN